MKATRQKQINEKIKNLIFLPIEIEIYKTVFSVFNPRHKTFQGLWDTQLIDPDDIEIKTITDQLPFCHVSLIKYNTQTADIPPHIDVQPDYVKNQEEYQHIKDNEPAGYRVVLSGRADRLEVFDGYKWMTARLPSCPFAYVLNSTHVKHRVIGEMGRRTLYFRGRLDKVRHQTLIQTNLEKYSDYAIYHT